jgi:hypothetical protein
MHGFYALKERALRSGRSRWPFRQLSKTGAGGRNLEISAEWGPIAVTRRPHDQVDCLCSCALIRQCPRSIPLAKHSRTAGAFVLAATASPAASAVSREELDLKALALAHGRAVPLASLADYLRCPRCGSRDVVCIFEPPSTVHSDAEEIGRQ